jgi:hypothetical protein
MVINETILLLKIVIVNHEICAFTTSAIDIYFIGYQDQGALFPLFRARKQGVFYCAPGCFQV